MDDQFLRNLLLESHTVAMVGLSSNPERDSFKVAAYLKEHGYRIVPVNPAVTEVLEETAYPSLKDIPESVDIVDIFRRSEEVFSIVAEAVLLKPKAIWMQLGVVNQEAARLAESVGIPVVMDHCMKREHIRLGL